MGLNADLMAFGHFKPELAEYLAYPAEFYEGVATGRMVIAHVVHCVTSDQSRGLAEALGTGPWELGNHFFVTLTTEQLAGLKEYFQKNEDSFGPELVRDMWAQTRILRENGFTFFFVPNG